MNLEQRALLGLATAKDAQLVGAVLQRAGIGAVACSQLGELAHEWARGAGALVLAEERLVGDEWDALKDRLRSQQPWSDIPILVLARPGADSHAIQDAMDEVGNVTVVERPVRVAAFVSALRTGLRGRRRQYELRALLDNLHEADRRKTEFLAMLAHELRNPMAPIGNAIALLEREPGRPPATASLHALMRRQLPHLVRLVDDLMELSRVTRGKVELQLAPLSLDLPLADALDQTRQVVEKARHRLEVDLATPAPVVLGDRVRLAQVFANLIVNAAKYTPAGGRLCLSMRAQRDNTGDHTGDNTGHHMALVEVSDSGAGLPGDMLHSIFDMFVQVGGTVRAAQGGLGIGLTLVKSLVEMHGGTVGAASDGLGQGSTFTVRLPLAESERHAPAAAGHRAPAGPGDRAEATPRLPGLNVLVLDDNADAADTLAQVLVARGAQVGVSHNAQDALHQAATRPWDVAILDIGMPHIDGCEVARRLRADPTTRQMHLIALTGLGSQADHRRVREAGFDHHLLKPAELGQLLAILAPLVDGSAAQATGPAVAQPV